MNIVILEPIGISTKKMESFEKTLSKQGHQLTCYDSQPTDETECIERARNSEVLMVVNSPISKNTINSCPNLKLISVAFTGFNHIPTDFCKEKGIVVCNAAGYSTDSVAELAFGLMISVMRNLVECDKITREGGTRKGLIGNELKGKTLGIIGTGAIGLRVAEIGKVFGCKLLGYSRTEKTKATEIGLNYVDLKTLLSKSDIVTIHTPLNSETKDLIAEKELKLMKQSAILIQTSRGGTVNEKALSESLNSGEIAGAGVDVFMIEPPLDPKEKLLKAKNVTVAPHVAFATKEALDVRADIAFTNIYKWIEGKEQNRIV